MKCIVNGCEIKFNSFWNLWSVDFSDHESFYRNFSDAIEEAEGW